MFIKAYESNGQWIAETATTRYTGETLEKAVESFHKGGGVAAIEVGIWSPRLHGAWQWECQHIIHTQDMNFPKLYESSKRDADGRFLWCVETDDSKYHHKWQLGAVDAYVRDKGHSVIALGYWNGRHWVTGRIEDTADLLRHATN